MIWKPINWSRYSKKDQIILNKSIKKFFPILGNNGFQLPPLLLFTNNNISQKRLNHQHIIYKLLHITNRIGIHTFLFSAIVKKNLLRGKSTYQKQTVFCKETPLLPDYLLELYEQKSNINNFNISDYLVYNYLYSLNNPVFTEYFANFILSNSNENNLSICETNLKTLGLDLSSISKQFGDFKIYLFI